MEILLNDPAGNPHHVVSGTVTEQVNGGWTWSVNVGEGPPLDDHLEDATWTLTLVDGGVTKTLPPLVATDYDKDEIADGGSISGMDLITYRLTRSTHTVNTYPYTDTNAIIDAMAAHVGLVGSISGYTAFNIPVMEQESGQRTNVLNPLQRILDVVCYEWRATAAGVLELYPLEINPAGAGTALNWTSVRRKRSFSSRITSMKFIKTTKIASGGAYSVTSGDVVDLASAGAPFHSAQVNQAGATLWQGDPGAGGTAVGTGVAKDTAGITHATAGATGQLVVMGTPNGRVPAGVELAFEHLHDSGISPPRPRDEPWRETLWPNKAYVIARAQTYLWRENRGTHTYSFEGPPALGLGLGEKLTWPGVPDSRIESITHTLGIGQASTSVEAAVLASDQW